MPDTGEHFHAQAAVERVRHHAGGAKLDTLEIFGALQQRVLAVVVDCRGRFESDGVFHAYVNDGPDTVDTLAWVANERWVSNRW